ncbi:TIGR02444 family protein [Pseudomonas duriflava]|nr:TIGR02444 family protein [Pseudomonas duriflava]
MSNMMTEALWPFALAVYTQPGVTDACLRLQAAGADVCLLLTAAWLDRQGIQLTPERQRVLESLAAPWRTQVIEPLRRVRTDWRAAAQSDPALTALRERLKHLEVDAERELLARLEQASVGWPADGQPLSTGWLAALSGHAGWTEPQALAQLAQAAID